VFHDELDLVPGKVRVKAGGGVAGHNGLRSITAHIGNDYVRVRIGIGHPGSKEVVVHHVLNNFAKSDREWLEPLLGAIAKAAPDLAEGAHDKFQSFVAHAMHMEAETADDRPEPSPRKRKDAPGAPSEKPAAAEGPFGKLRRWFGS
jgi:PTH1 family peptidyl-tRNA hydrolase